MLIIPIFVTSSDNMTETAGVLRIYECFADMVIEGKLTFHPVVAQIEGQPRLVELWLKPTPEENG